MRLPLLIKGRGAERQPVTSVPIRETLLAVISFSTLRLGFMV